MNRPHHYSIEISQVTDRDVLNELATTANEAYVRKKMPFVENTILVDPDKKSLTSISPVEPSQSVVALQDLDDTVHYLSPATTPSTRNRSAHEGDIYDYQIYQTPSIVQLLEDYERIPSYISTITPCDETVLQRTLVIIKPEAMQYKDVILRAIQDAGFTIIRERQLHLTPEQVSEIYAKYYGTSEFPFMVVTNSAATCLTLCMSGKCAVNKWNKMIGPEGSIRAEWFYPMSMRVRFGLKDEMHNMLHGSNTMSDSIKENRYINPNAIIEPIINQEEKVWDFCNKFINPTLLNGLAEVVRAKPIDPILHLADWLLKHDPFQPQLPDNVAVLST